MLLKGLKAKNWSVGMTWKGLRRALSHTTKQETLDMPSLLKNQYMTQRGMLICFDQPTTWFNWLWCIAFNQRWEHARIIFPIGDSEHAMIVEHTWHGTSVGLGEVSQFKNVTAVTWIPIDLDTVGTINTRIVKLQSLGIRFSVLYGLIALLTGDCPSFTCTSAILYIVTGCTDHNILPEELHERLL